LVALVAGHLNVTLVTPRGTPRVLDQPVVLAAVSAITNSQDTVVQVLGRAHRLIVDTRLVELEGVVGSIDGNGDGANGGNGGLQSSLRAGLDILVAGDGTTRVGSIVTASTITSSVGVRSLGVKTLVGDDIGEGIVHQTTVATLVTLLGGAVNQVLLREGDELASSLEVSTLDGAGGGERPARTALALILDGGDVALSAPVDGRGVNLVAGNVNLSSAGGIALHGAKVSGLEFSIGQVTELVHAQLEGVALAVVLVDVSQVLVEDSLAHRLLSTEVGLLVLQLPGGPGSINVQLGLDAGSQSSGNNKSQKGNALHLTK